MFQCGHVYHDTCLLFASNDSSDYSLALSQPSSRRVLGASHDESGAGKDKYTSLNWREKRKYIQEKELKGEVRLVCPMCRERMGLASSSSTSSAF